MIRSIEIPEPLFESHVEAQWNREEDTDVFWCKVLVAGKFAVYERTYTSPSMVREEDEVLDEFLAEFSTKFKTMMEGTE